MAYKTINDNPRTTDVIAFDLETPGSDGCFMSDPYKVDKIVIYFVERNFLGGDYGEYDKVLYDETLVQRLKTAKALACTNPTDANLAAVDKLLGEVDASAQSSSFYFNDAQVVLTAGSSSDPAWTSVDPTNSLLTHVTTDADGNVQYGHFQYVWRPEGGVRGGDFFICWTWTPNVSGDSISNHVSFSLSSDPRSTVTVPSHLTPDIKYNVLLDRYLPELYKRTLSANDITPQTLQNLNGAIAKGFKGIEDQANQLIDLFDANALHESFLVYQANLFNLRLKSSDPTLWRRQIKEAIPLFKKKGTLGALQDAFAQAGMTLNKVTRLWQVVSPYTWQESFKVVDSPTFNLAKLAITPIDPNYFSVWVRRSDETEYTLLSPDHVLMDESPCGFYSTITWIGDELSSGSVNLYAGDILRIKYQYAEVPAGKESIEQYINALPLADQRDEATQDYPLKNWNVRVIEEDDSLFQVIIPVRHPYYDPLVFGKVRTEFPYSENIYNMDEYNGSTRDSIDPCNIDRNFVDPCGSCMSSKYNLDLSVEELCDDRVAEITDILREYTPFHAFVHSINYKGEVNEFVSPPVEQIEMLIKYRFNEVVLCGSANPFFTRMRNLGLTTWRVDRDQLADEITEVSGQTGTAYNLSISLVAPNMNLGSLGIDRDSHRFEVLAPSPNAGLYQLGQVTNNTAVVTTPVLEPLNQNMFTFRLSNIMYSGSNASIDQDNVFFMTDDGVDFALLGVKTTWDVENTPDYTGNAWKVSIPDYSLTPYTISHTLPDGSIVLEDHGQTLPPTSVSGVTYTILDSADEEVAFSDSGVLTIQNQGRVDINDSGMVLEEILSSSGFLLFYDGVEYPIVALDDDNVFYIFGYTGGNATGRPVEIRKRLVNDQIGYFGYGGWRLLTSTNYEASLGMLNGQNPPYTDPDDITDNSQWKENFLVKIDDDYYRVSDIDGTTIMLDGNPQDWGTLAAGGTLVQFSILHFVEQEIDTEFMVFDQLDRDGKDPVVREITSTVDQTVAIIALQAPDGADVSDLVRQEESVSFVIEWKDGTTKKGELL